MTLTEQVNDTHQRARAENAVLLHAQAMDYLRLYKEKLKAAQEYQLGMAKKGETEDPQLLKMLRNAETYRRQSKTYNIKATRLESLMR